MQQVLMENYKITNLIERLHKLCKCSQKEEVNACPPQIEQSSADFVQLCNKLAEMVKMYDQMAKQMPAGEAKDLAEDFSDQIITTLSLCDGCTAIINEPTLPLRIASSYGGRNTSWRVRSDTSVGTAFPPFMDCEPAIRCFAHCRLELTLLL